MYSFFSSFCLTLSFCFYELGETATSPGLERVASCGESPLYRMLAPGSFHRPAGAGVGVGWGHPLGSTMPKVILEGQLELEWAGSWEESREDSNYGTCWCLQPQRGFQKFPPICQML